MQITQITEITDAQDELIPDYMYKWRQICLSTQRIDYVSAIEAVELAYLALGRPMPQVRFFESPYAVLLQCFGTRLLKQHTRYQQSLSQSQHFHPLKDLLGRALKESFEQQLERDLIAQIQLQIAPELWQELKLELYIELGCRLWSHIDDQMTHQLLTLRTTTFRPVVRAMRRMQPKSTYPAAWTAYTGLLDFCISALGCTYNPEIWTAHRLLVQECGWVFPFENYCLVCDRSNELSYTNELTSSDYFHADGKPAIQFLNGFKLYCNHGNLISEVAAIAMHN